jgi:hypothetical protein
MTLLLAPTALHSSQCNQQNCKLANNIQNKTTTKAATELRLTIIIIIIIIIIVTDTNKKKNCMKLNLEIILYVPGLVRKKRAKALWLYMKRNKVYCWFHIKSLLTLEV